MKTSLHACLSPLCVSLCLCMCVCVCMILLLHQSPWMPATHRAISHRFSQPCKHNIYLSATLSGLLYVAPKKSSEKWSCCLGFILHFRCPCRRPGVGRRSCQADHWGGKEREGRGGGWSPNPARINSYTHIHLQSSRLFPSSLYRFI